MDNELKAKIHQLVDSIEDQSVLEMIMEEIAYYAGHKEILDELDDEQQKELNKAILEADDDEAIDWEDFKKQMSEWEKK